MQKIFKNHFFIAFLFLLLFSVIAFVPKIQHFGFYNDDWWQIFGAENFGLDRFPEMYTSDRPARAYWHAFLYSIFGSNILPYQISAVGIRLLGSLALLWTLRLVWTKQTKATLIISLLYLIYPGFLEQPNGFDYQSHLVAMMIFILSLGLSILSINTGSKIKRFGFLFVSVLLSFLSFLFMEYYIGLEIYRWLFFLVFYLRKNKIIPLKNTFNYIFKLIPHSFSLVIFLFWRIFFFKSTRYTTDISRLGYEYLESPFVSVINIIRRWIGDIVDVFFTVWVKKGYKNLYELNTSDFIVAILLGLISVVIFLLLWKLLSKPNTLDIVEVTNQENRWKIEVIVIGLLGAIICLIPINLANREVYFPIFNRFSFPSSIGVSMTIVGLVSYILKNRWQLIPYSLIILSAITTHYSNNTYYADRWKETQNLWQQWIWRIPSIEKGTMLTGFYPEPIQEGYFIWSPANLLYYFDSPEVMIGAEVLNNDTYKDMKLGSSYEKSFRSFYFNFSYEDILVFTKPTRNSCLRIFDNNQIELSIYDHPLISLISSESQINRISPENSINYTMFEQVFGKQNEEQTWCYIYEKASLARQFGNWQEIIEYHKLAQENNLTPFDPIEWFPFMQAYAYTNNIEGFNQFVPAINETPYYRYQACQLFINNDTSSDSDEKAGNELIQKTFCD